MNKIIKNFNNAPEVFPMPWADEWGKDRYGIWMAFIYKNIRQYMRWIKPGKFTMGSSGDEKERKSDETQHEVILTEGFWLADTTCTQELWQAVMGHNPSHFKGPQKPVDSVNWNDCLDFFQKFSQLKPGLEPGLPSEAQWEYACRAGTQTPFSFGENITPEQVNYDGDHPYVGGKKGKYRGQTVEVKSLPCNKWGLYQMHGNVWEWCADWYGDYPAARIINPTGPDSGEDRVVRGGSWIINGRNARSAVRIRLQPSNRSRSRGLRFIQVNWSTGRNKEENQQEKSRQEPDGADAAERNR